MDIVYSNLENKQYQYNFWMMLIYTCLMPVMCTIIRAPYGKFVIKKWWIPLITNKDAFLIMELPNLVTVILCIFFKKIPHWTNGIIMTCFFLYAFNRAIMYPASIIRVKKNWPIQLVLFGTIFTTLNSLNQISVFYGNYNFWKPNVFLGFFIWIYAFYETWYADRQLLKLASQSKGYVLPSGRWFDLITCPHYAFEILMWFGYFMMSVSQESFLFLMATIFNVLPRALYTHKYYQTNFGSQISDLNLYALVPFIL